MDSGSGDKRPVRISVFNQNYTVLTAGDPAEVEQLARSLDELMNTIARSGNMDAGRVAILAALHLADRLRTMERELEQFRQRVDDKSRRFSLLLDQAFGS